MPLKIKNKSKGNRKEQKRRRKERLKNRPERAAVSYRLIDGNFSHYPVAECKCHGGYLTQGLIDTHRCEQRHCTGFRKVAHDEKT